MTSIVDRETGLVVERNGWQRDPSGEQTNRTTLADLEIVDDVPAAFPCEFPDGAEVPERRTVVDGALCNDVDGDGECDRDPSADVVAARALAGWEV